MIPTVLPQSSGAYQGLSGRTDAQIQADRLTLNTKIRANTAGADGVSDPANDGTIGAYPVSASLFPDYLHPNSAGYSLASAFNPPATLALVA